ncbi:MAG: glutamate--tRNA ligase [Myxococcaceae bacterium]|nr:glutamate--tRNA ligase [Myxococcaceae bacterium]
MHIGGARTALFNWLYARRYGGAFILRIEDTDQKRSTEASLQAILDALNWLKIDWDEGPQKGGPYGPYFQTQRLERYAEVAEQLIAEGKAFRCYCTPEELEPLRKQAEKEKRAFKYPGTCRELKAPPPGKTRSVVRFKLQSTEGTIRFKDRVLGEIAKPMSDMDDWVMLRGDGIPLYSYGCVLDDHDMAITLVARGQEHVNSTFPQLLLYQALGWEPPEFAHLPLILAPNGEKLSKRKHADADVMNHKHAGILPEALLNYVVRLGWSHGNDEVIPVEKMIEWFDFDAVGATSGKWDHEKLLWLNQQYLMSMPVETITDRWLPYLEEKSPGAPARPRAQIEGVVRLLRPRSRTLVEMAETARYFFSDGVTIDEKAFAKVLTPEARPLLSAAREQLAQATWSTQALDAVVKQVAESAGVGMGKVAQPIRVAVTGGTTSPGIGETLELIGRDESLRRIDAALAKMPA